MNEFWIVCCERFDWDGPQQHHKAVCNGVFSSKEKAEKAIEELKERYEEDFDSSVFDITGPIFVDIGYPMVKGDDSVFDGLKWIKRSTLKTRFSKKIKEKSDTIVPPGRQIDMDFDVF